MANDVVRVTQLAIEALVPAITSSPTTITGAGVSQDMVEALYANANAAAHVTQDVIEALVPLGTASARVTQDVVEVLFPKTGPT